MSATSESRKKERELKIFCRFVETCPNFAGARISDWTPGPDPPDVIVTDASGGRIGVELTELRDQGRTDADEGLKKLLRTAVSKKGLNNVTIVVNRFDLEREQWNKKTRCTLNAECEQLLSYIKSKITSGCLMLKPEVLQPDDLKTIAPSLARDRCSVTWCQAENGVNIYCWRILGLSEHGIPTPGLLKKSTHRALTQCLKNKTSSKAHARYSRTKSERNLGELILVIHCEGLATKGVPYWRQLPSIARGIMRTQHGAFDRAFFFEDMPVRLGTYRRCHLIYP